MLSRYCADNIPGGTASCVPERELKSTVMDALRAPPGSWFPDTVTVWGLSLAPSVRVNNATRVPTAVGLKAAVTAQDAPAFRIVPQVVFEMVKSCGSVLVKAILEIDIADEELL